MDMEGELLFAETITILGVKVNVDVLCSMILDGNMGPDGADDITELLNLDTDLIDLTPLVEPGLECTNIENCAEPLLWFDKLPWLTLLELMEDPSNEDFFVDLWTSTGAGEPGYHLICMEDASSDLCTWPEAIAKVTNIVEGLDIEFSEAFTELAGGDLADCEVAGEDTGIVEGLLIALIIGAGSLMASSEG
jgi:hypothetical protein